jgi:hypothetical protein
MADQQDPKQELNSSPAKPEPQPAPKIQIIAAIGRLFAAPFVAVGRLVRGSRKIDEVVVYSAPPAFFLWIVLATGFGLGALVPTVLNERAAAWVFIFVIVYFTIAILYDLSLKKLLLCSLVVSVLWLFAKYMESLHNVVILGTILKHFAALDPKYDHGTVSVLCWILLVPWVASLLEMYFNRKKKFSPNEIAEFHFGEGSELTDRSGLRFVTKYRDVLETLMGFGGGDLLAVDNHQTVIKRYENIVGLWFHWEHLDRILHQRATLVDEESPDNGKPAG